MRAFLRLLGLAAATLVFGWAQGAGAAATAWVGDGHAAARLITAVEAVGSGSTIDAGLEIRLAPGWHAYWRAPGDAGIPPSIDWAGSTNLTKAEIAWPAPTRFSQQGFETAVYNDRVVLPIALTLAQAGRPLALHAEVDYAACAEICVPYSASFNLALPTGVASPGPEAGLIAAARARVPVSPETAGFRLLSATVSGVPDTALTVRVQSAATAFRAPDLFVEGIADGSPGRPAVEIGDGGRTAHFTVPIRDAGASGIVAKPLTLTLVDGPKAAEFVTAPVAGAAPATPSGLLSILAAAILGGLILNVMPCVLPVLSLKLLSVASQAGAERGRVRIGLLMTALGVLASFALIAAMLIGLKTAGAAVGWGMQFQSPWFIAGMAAVTTLFAASLWGWLPIAAPRFAYDAAAVHSGRRPHLDAFLTGAFATLLATPCSAPFVGTAVGFALSRGPAEIAVVLLAMGLGFAAPYLAAAAFPWLVEWLPRPGRWMRALCVVLGLALAGTAVWLLFVLAALSGARAAVGTGIALAVVLLLLMVKSRHGAPSGFAKTASAGAAALLAAAIVWPAFAVGDRAPAPARAEGLWRPFDQAAIPRLVAAGKTVFVDVTAAWCLTCKLNEAAVIDRDPVAGRLSGPGVVAMRTDWTRPDPVVAAYLRGFGRYGIPFNAVYGPGRPEGVALPELLSSEAVTSALDGAAEGGRAPGAKDE